MMYGKPRSYWIGMALCGEADHYYHGCAYFSFHNKLPIRIDTYETSEGTWGTAEFVPFVGY
jgi:hypothetical protein